MPSHYLGVVAETEDLVQRYILKGLVLIVSPDCFVCTRLKTHFSYPLPVVDRPVLRSVSDVLMRIPLDL